MESSYDVSDTNFYPKENDNSEENVIIYKDVNEVKTRPLIQKLFDNDYSKKRKRNEETYDSLFSVDNIEDDILINSVNPDIIENAIENLSNSPNALDQKSKSSYKRRKTVKKTKNLSKKNGSNIKMNKTFSFTDVLFDDKMEIKAEPIDYEYAMDLANNEMYSGPGSSQLNGEQMVVRPDWPNLDDMIMRNDTFEKETINDTEKLIPQKESINVVITPDQCLDTNLNNELENIQDQEKEAKSKKKNTVPDALLIGGPDKRKTVKVIADAVIEELEKTGKRRIKVETRGYPCKNCGEVFATHQEHKVHLISHQTETRHKCPECSKCFTRSHDLVLHARVHSGERPYECEFCKKAFSQKINMIRHVRIHTNEKPFICNICEESFLDQGYLAKHVRLHTGDNPYICLICKLRFPELQLMKEHSAREHTEGPVFNCNVCGAGFPDRTSKRTHIMNNHSEARPFICNDCGKKLKVQIIKHLRTHSGLRPYRCKYCNKTFAGESSYSLHVKRHVGIKQHECPVCTTLFYNAGILRRHMRCHSNDRPYQCELCTRQFKSSDSRKRHIKIVHERKWKEWKCEFKGCMEKYAAKANMLRHMRSFHYSMKPYVCDVCETGFTSKGSMLTHSKVRHSSIRDVHCKECPKSYVDEVSLNRHMRTKHPDKYY